MIQHRRPANEGAALTFKPSFFPLAADTAACQPSHTSLASLTRPVKTGCYGIGSVLLA